MWTKFNKNIRQHETRKLFYNKYIYKVRFLIPCAKAVVSRHDVNTYISYRHNEKHYNPMGSWYPRNRDQRLPDSEETAILHHIKKFKEDNPELKIRVESDNIDFYHNDSTFLYNNLNIGIDYITDVWEPNTSNMQEILEGKQIVKNTDFKYKVICREGKLPQQEKQAILDYLTSLDPAEVKMTKSFIDQLEKPYMLYGCYFYLNDLQYLTLLKIMSPNLIRNYIELVPANQ